RRDRRRVVVALAIAVAALSFATSSAVAAVRSAPGATPIGQGDRAAADTATSPVDSLLAACPSAAEVAAVNGDLQLTFEGDPTAGQLVCTSAAGSADLTLLQRRVYGTLNAMKALSFSTPLPWTSNALYPWLVSAIDGIRFRNDIDTSFCCD